MGHFKYQLPIPNTHQFTHLSPEAHTPLVQLPARELRPPPLTAQGRWSLPCPEGPVLLLGPLGPKTPGQGLGRPSQAGLGGELHLQTKGGRAQAVWVGPGCSTGPSAGDELGPPPQR